MHPKDLSVSGGILYTSLLIWYFTTYTESLRTSDFALLCPFLSPSFFFPISLNGIIQHVDLNAGIFLLPSTCRWSTLP